MKPQDCRHVDELCASLAAGGQAKFVMFWGHTPRADGRPSNACFSQWFAAGFKDDDEQYYPTAEHYMMAEKARLFGDDAQLEKALHAKSPGAAKAAGRAVKGFDPKLWEANRFEIVTQASVLKFAQNPDIGAFLQDTKTRVLVEASPQDRIWGIGLARDDENAEHPQKWRGLNLLGFALMEARSRLS